MKKETRKLALRKDIIAQLSRTDTHLIAGGGTQVCIPTDAYSKGCPDTDPHVDLTAIERKFLSRICQSNLAPCATHNCP